MRTKTYAADWLDNASDAIDLRKRRADALNDRIVQRAEWLEPHEKTLVLAMFADGYSAAEIARLGNLPVRLVRSRIHRIVTRLSDPLTAYVMGHSDSWSKTRRTVGREVFVNGRSLRETATLHSMSFYIVRRHREAIQALYEADQNAARKLNKASIQSRQWR